ncbi:GNAT family N-acetyltransferase [Galactobacter caseinivorans]|uniref:N-acetyltransferase n=1 Tax=Galactobacter caseinivorans TaxID=2676123 RepID=A0A496PIX7_9MICC|nr:GNAT family protein [Galactobacter caseinivorans]RKW70455.1 N-acetyltransferase [Galactobacter caseinivorans]
MPTRIRLLDTSDAEALAAQLSQDRARLRPYEPTRPESWFTVDGQRQAARAKLEAWEAGTGAPFVILDDAEEVVGAMYLNDVVRGAFQNAHPGYWLAGHATGRGYASQALGEAAGFAFHVLGLHRLQAATLLDNVASQRVLAACGFTQVGVAPGYLQIDGAWRDHRLYQLLAPGG